MKKILAMLLAMAMMLGCVAFAEAVNPDEIADSVTAADGKAVCAPLPGRVIEIKVKAGDKVTVGQEVMILEAMKMENSISSDYAGEVLGLLVAEGDTVAADQALLVIK